MNIIVSSVYSKLDIDILDVTPQIDKCVRDINTQLRVKDPSANYSEKYNTFNEKGERSWDGYVRFFNPKTKAFYTGLLPLVKKIITKHGIDITIDNRQFIPECDCRIVHELPHNTNRNKHISLRDYQRDGVNIALNGTHRGIYNYSTNGGKTLTAVAITESIPVKTLFLVDRIELLRQAYKAFKDYGTRDVGIISSDTFEPREVTIGMQKTIHSKLKNEYLREEMMLYLNSVEMFFGDECHLASSTTWRYVLRHIQTAYYRYGLSATPFLEDKIRNMYLLGLIGPVIQRITNKQLIDAGYSANPIINMVKFDSPRLSTGLDFSEAYLEGVVENEERNDLIVKIIKSHQGKSILTIVKNIEHGKLIEEQLNQEDGYFISGKSTKQQRITIYNQFSNKRIPIVIASLIYKYGIDIAAIDVLIYAAGIKAPATVIQVIGRGLRARVGKANLYYYDFMDESHQYLRTHLEKRLAMYEEQEFDIIEISPEDI